MSLDEKLVLQRIDRLTIEVPDAESLMLRTAHRSVHCGPHGLAVLDAFAHPTSVEDAMARLKGRSAGVQDWVDLIATIDSLHTERILVEPETVLAERRSRPRGTDVSAYHVMMLEDRDRTGRFIEAIEATVQEGDVVVDIGTGTGILAMAAARAGARRVFAIEAGEVAEAAEALFAANGLSDRIELVRGWSTRVDLPERADVLVSEVIGAQPLGERVLEVTRDAFERHLREGARTVPSRVRIFALPVPEPQRKIGERWFTPEAVRRWHEWYGFEFGTLTEAARRDTAFFNMLDEDVRDLGALAAPASLGDVDLDASRDLVFDATATSEVTGAGRVGAVAIYFELELAEGIELTNDPARAGGTNHWANPVGVLPAPIDVEEGDHLEIRYRYGGLEHELSCRKL